MQSLPPVRRVAELGSLDGTARMKNWNIPLPQLSPRVRLWYWGALASTLTVCLGYNLRFASLLLWMLETWGIGEVAWILLLYAAVAAFTVCLWVEFYRAWKRRGSQ